MIGPDLSRATAPRARVGRSAFIGVAIAGTALWYIVWPVDVARWVERDTVERETAGIGRSIEAAAAPVTDEHPPPVRVFPLERWLGDIAADAGLGLVLAPELVGADVAASFSDGTAWHDKLEALSRIYGFVFRSGGGVLEVAPAVDSPAPTAPFAALAAAAPERAPPAPPVHATAALRLSNARATDLVAALEKPLGGVAVSAGVDAATNAVVFGGPDLAVRRALELARALDVPRRRFLLEAHIVELSRSARMEMGVQWTLESNEIGGIVDFPAADAAGESAGVVVATTGSHTLRARLSALESNGRVRVISRPRIVVLEGKPASIEAVRILRVRLPDRGSVLSDGDAPVSVDGGRAFEEIPVGVTLRVEPSMQGEGNVVLRITAKSSTLGPPQPPDDIPEELSRRVEAEVVVADGRTAVLGGLLREGRARAGSGVPLLRSLPVVGALFGKTSRERDVEELIVLVTPRLLDRPVER